MCLRTMTLAGLEYASQCISLVPNLNLSASITEVFCKDFSTLIITNFYSHLYELFKLSAAVHIAHPKSFQDNSRTSSK